LDDGAASPTPSAGSKRIFLLEDIGCSTGRNPFNLMAQHT